MPTGFYEPWITTGSTAATGYQYYTDRIWSNWVISSGSTSTTVNQIRGDLWLNSGTSSNFTPAQDASWTLWNTTFNSTRRTEARPWIESRTLTPPPVMELTAQEKLQRMWRRWSTIGRQAGLAREKKAAAERAKDLLLSILSPDQQVSYHNLGHIDVESQHGRVYRITRGHAGNVQLVRGKRSHTPRGWIRGSEDRFDVERNIYNFCAHPYGEHQGPVEDTMLTQMLMLMTDEDRFLSIANESRLPRR